MIARRFLPAAALALAFAVLPAHAQDFPGRPVKIVVPAAPGGLTDQLARVLAQRLSDTWAQPVIVENRAGANQIIGAEAVARAQPDGYTLFVSDSSTFVINPHLYKKLPYDGLRDFTPITILGSASPVIAVHPSVAAHTMQELVALSKSQPGALKYGSMGSGSYVHVSMEDLKRRSSADLLHVPYKGAAPATADVLSGQIQVVMGSVSLYKQHAAAGKLRIIAAATPQRLAAFPELRTVAESGVPGWQASTWFGLVGPARMDDKVRDRIYGDVAKILAAADFRAQVLSANDVEAVQVTPTAFAERMRSESEMWKALVQQSGASLD